MCTAVKLLFLYKLIYCISDRCLCLGNFISQYGKIRPNSCNLLCPICHWNSNCPFSYYSRSNLEELKPSKTRRQTILCKDSIACVINLLWKAVAFPQQNHYFQFLRFRTFAAQSATQGTSVWRQQRIVWLLEGNVRKIHVLK